MKFPSIRRALLIRCGIGVGVLLCLLSITVYFMVRRSFYSEVDQSITQTAALLSNQVELENGTILYEWQEGIGTNDSLLQGALFQFWNERSGESCRSPALKQDDLPKFTGKNGTPKITDIRLTDGRYARALGMQIFPFVLPAEWVRMKLTGKIVSPASLPHTLVVASDMEATRRTLRHLRYALATGTLLTLALGFTLIDHVIRLSLKPIDELSEQVAQRAEHQLDAALQLPGAFPEELAGLATNFDALLARVASIRQREKDFIRHAAHELRTPIAGLNATVELALSKPRSAEAYVNHLSTCWKSLREMEALVKRLSSLARMGQRSSHASENVSFDLGHLLNECLKPFLADDENHHLDWMIEVVDPKIKAVGDPVLTRLVCNNLFDNAACHAPRHSKVWIHCERRESWVVLKVKNAVKFPIEDPERLFEPLFRANEHSADAGNHLGIGLTLSLEAANAMGGTLKARNTADDEIEFEFALPEES